MDLGLRGRAAVVAGGSRGIGRATAELLASEGCRVAVLARTESDLRETEDELGTHMCIPPHWEERRSEISMLEPIEADEVVQTGV